MSTLGEYPFVSQDFDDLKEKIKNDNVQPVFKDKNNKQQQIINYLIMLCLNKDPKQRPSIN